MPRPDQWQMPIIAIFAAGYDFLRQVVGFLPEFFVRPSSQTLRCELVVVFRGVVVAVEKVFTVQLYQRDQRWSV